MAKASESVTRASPVVERALSKIVTKEDLGGALIAVDKAGSIDNAANSEEDAFAQIKRFLILHKELDADDGELTRTRKVRRNFIAERYEQAKRPPISPTCCYKQLVTLCWAPDPSARPAFKEIQD